ncbi:MAG: hypothetical protein IKE57_05275 [Oscillospiraceae bacterium]|nr:hypothetical protein [Oscillospiraceae bacterium]
MKKILLWLLILSLCLSLAACSSGQSAPGAADEPRPTDTSVHRIGVIVYNTGDEEVIGFREYLQGYIESNFEMVKFLYSDSIQTEEQELEFIQQACDQGAEGFLSFLSRDLAAEVALCEKNQAYYLLASGVVSDEDFDAVADNPWFLGMFGPGRPFEFQAGADMARYFLREKTGNRYFILSGGAPLGNEMHYQRTLGILDTLSAAYGVDFPQSRTDLAKTEEPVTLALDKLAVTICPGYVNREEYAAAAKDAFAAGTYDAVLAVLPPAEMASVIGKTPLGVVDSYNTRNLQLSADGVLKFVVGKYSSLVGPAFALMLNAVTGHAAEFREKGRAIQVTQGFWTSDSEEDYLEKYALSISANMIAYNFEDLSRVICIYNPDANLNELVALAEACSYQAVITRRSSSAG